jgi:hypothetical protein
MPQHVLAVVHALLLAQILQLNSLPLRKFNTLIFSRKDNQKGGPEQRTWLKQWKNILALARTTENAMKHVQKKFLWTSSLIPIGIM